MQRPYSTTQPPARQPLDALLAPLDDIGRTEEPAPSSARLRRARAYGLTLLAAELIEPRADPSYLYDYLTEMGIGLGDAQTIARAFSLAIERVAGWVESGQRE